MKTPLEIGMDTIAQTNAAVESVRQAYEGKSDRPRPEWVHDTCPDCGEQLVSNCYYIHPGQYRVMWECWGFLQNSPTCDYRKVI